MSLLSVNNLNVRYAVAGKFKAAITGLSSRFVDAVIDVSFEIPAGKTLAVVGESGSGKSSLARAIAGLTPFASGSITFDGKNPFLNGNHPERAYHREVAIMFQDPVSSLSPRRTVKSLITEPFVIHGMKDRDLEAEARRLLGLIGLPADFASRYPHQLSGGQARRVGVARAIALNPKLIIADEPTAGLDVSVQGDTGATLIAAKGKLPAGTPITYEGVGTMSKSKNNGVDPQDLIEKYGADTARLYTMFTAPPEATLEWNDAAVEGSYRFLRRVWNFGYKLNATIKEANYVYGTGARGQFGKEIKALRLEIHSVLKQVDYDYQRMQYNTVVSGAMKLLNALEDFKGAWEGDNLTVVHEGFGILLRCLYPVTPHLAHTLWAGLDYVAHDGDLLDAAWPSVDDAALLQDEIELMLQINGKLRGSMVVGADASRQAIEKMAAAHELVQKFAKGGPIKRVIVVPGRLVNVVL